VVLDHKDINEDQRERNGELAFVSALAFMLSMVAFVWFYRRGDILLWGDAVAHINIARRIVDARDPGWGQIGTVWLPLPHLLVAPFVANDWLWRTGIGGSIPSMFAYVLGVAGVYRLVRARAAAPVASLAAAIYALNPSMLYMQSTAMTESIFLATVIWSVVYFDEFLRGLFPGTAGTIPAMPAWRAIERCGLCLAAAIFTRYDGWIIAFIVGVCATFAALRWLSARPSQQEIGRLARSMFSFLLLLALCPTLWLAHNYKNNGHPLDWLNGPYSAKAIEKRSSRPGDPPYPGKNNVKVAAQYFLKAARMNTGEGSRQNWLILLAVAGVLLAAFDVRRFGVFFLLWIPLPFYAFSVAYSSVPIFVPEWWPFSYYNVRYGLELLPAIAVFVAVIPWAVSRLHRRSLTVAATAVLFIAVLLAFNSSAWCFSRRSQDRNWGRKWMIPICYREAWANSRSRLQLEAQVAQSLEALPDDATILMYTSDYVGAIQKTGIHLNRIVSECTQFAWDSARSAPFAGADYIVAIAGDPVAEAVRINPRGLTKVAIIRTLGKPEVTIYRGSRP
jgi:4-amino-4-deoxy-L-arabinose transferase-like glycosyltransferase